MGGAEGLEVHINDMSIDIATSTSYKKGVTNTQLYPCLVRKGCQYIATSTSYKSDHVSSHTQINIEEISGNERSSHNDVRPRSISSWQAPGLAGSCLVQLAGL